MSDAGWELQVAVYDKLTSTLAVPGTARVYDHMPPLEERQFPYVTLGEDFMRDFGSKSRIGTEHVFSLHAWSRSGDWYEVKKISALIHAAFHEKEVSLTSGVNVMTRFIDARSMDDPDGVTRHGIQRFRFFVAN